MSFRQLILLCALAVCSATVAGKLVAQQSQTEPQLTEDEPQEQATETPLQPADMPDIDNQPIERPAGESPGRFIPSEQISQDLGVSFPVDI